MKAEKFKAFEKAIFCILAVVVFSALCYALIFELSFEMNFFKRIINLFDPQMAVFMYYGAYGLSFLIGISFCFLYNKNILPVTRMFTTAGNLLVLLFILSPLRAANDPVWILVLFIFAEMTCIIAEAVRCIKNKDF